jgi:hypothetical protein
MATQQFILQKGQFIVTGGDGKQVDSPAIKVTVEQDGQALNAWLDMCPDIPGDPNGKNGKPIRYADQKNQFKDFPQGTSGLIVWFGDFECSITAHNNPQFSSLASAVIGKEVQALV